MRRRDFLKILSSLISIVGTGCQGNQGIGNVINEKLPDPDILLSGDEESISRMAKNQLQNLIDISRDLNKKLRVGIVREDGMRENLVFQFKQGDLANYRYLRITREFVVNGKLQNVSANFLWGLDGIKPLIRVVDDFGNKITEVNFTPPRSSSKRLNANEWITLGIRVAALAFLIWAGAGLAKFIVSVIGFLAFNAMVLGILAFGVGIAIQILQIMGINLDDIIRLFQSSVDLIKELIRKIASSL